mmetsp:Transcript_106139/g.257832  ORF Transcript_106139/g.257832 Transcript_106139/m.257832 type:complete len:380 (+) Transcript_106139:70-1209(+)
MLHRKCTPTRAVLKFVVAGARRIATQSTIRAGLVVIDEVRIVGPSRARVGPEADTVLRIAIRRRLRASVAPLAARTHGTNNGPAAHSTAAPCGHRPLVHGAAGSLRLFAVLAHILLANEQTQLVIAQALLQPLERPVAGLQLLLFCLVVLVELMLEVVQVTEALDVHLVLGRKLLLQSLVLVHEVWAQHLDRPQSLLTALELSLLLLDLGLQALLIRLHLLALAFQSLHVFLDGRDGIADALLHVGVLRSGVQVARNGIQEQQRLLSCLAQLLLLPEQIVQLHTDLRDLARDRPRGLEVGKLRRQRERRAVALIRFALVLGAVCPVQCARDLEQLLHGLAVSGVQVLRLEGDARLAGHYLGDRLEEVDAIRLGLDVVAD